MARVLGVGGVFFSCKDTDVTRDWYVRVLGMTAEDFGGFVFPNTKATATHGDKAFTVFAPFAGDSDYFAPSTQPYMVNLMVDDIDGILVRVGSEGVDQVKPAETSDFGRFAWIMDPDGRKVELWQPPG